MDATTDTPSAAGALVEPVRPSGLPALGFDQWYDAVSAAFVPLEAATPSAATFVGDLATTPLGVMELACVSGSPVTVNRTPRTIRAADSGYLKVSVQAHGYCVLTQDGREAALTPGDVAVYDTTRPYGLLFAHDFQQLVLMLPRQLLSARPRDLTDVTARCISGRTGMGAVLSPFLTLLARQALVGELQPSMEVCDAVVDLVSATCRSTADSVDAVPHMAQQALLLRVQTYIDQRLSDPSLDAGTVAAAHHMSVRYLQKLFQAEGTTVSAWIRRRRLERCLRDLRDERLRAIPAAAIGARLGYTDPANFTRAFRREFGNPPSTFRPA
jgi:AraC-like DNA-binding protein